jgi:hypothetical protein
MLNMKKKTEQINENDLSNPLTSPHKTHRKHDQDRNQANNRPEIPFKNKNINKHKNKEKKSSVGILSTSYNKERQEETATKENRLFLPARFHTPKECITHNCLLDTGFNITILKEEEQQNRDLQKAKPLMVVPC